MENADPRMSWTQRIKSLLRELSEAKEDAVEKVNDFFEWWARICFHYPCWVIVGSVVVTLISCIGFLPSVAVWVDGAENLYSMASSPSQENRKIHDNLFSDSLERPQQLIISGTKPGENIFTWKHLEAVQQLDDLIRGKTVDSVGRRVAVARPADWASNSSSWVSPPSPNPKSLSALNEFLSSLDIKKKPSDDRGDASFDVLTYQDICSRMPSGLCNVQSVLETDPFLVRSQLLKENDPPELYVFGDLIFNTAKRGFVANYIFGKPTVVPCVRELPRVLLESLLPTSSILPGASPSMARANISCLIGAEAFFMIYFVDNRALQVNDVSLAWELSFIDTVRNNMVLGSITVAPNAFRSRDDELKASTSGSGDVMYVVATFMLVMTYATSLNFTCDLYRSKALPAVAGCCAALMGLVAGLGFGSLLGLEFVPTALVCPFLIIGVGVDDMFVIVNSYALMYTAESAEQRCCESLRDSGLAIAITTTTNILSFVIGSSTPYLSIKNFCIFCAAGLAMGWIFCVSFFFSILCIDAKREEAQKLCYCPCQTLPPKAAVENDLEPEVDVPIIIARKVEHSIRRRRERQAQRRILKYGESKHQTKSWGVLGWLQSRNDYGTAPNEAPQLVDHEVYQEEPKGTVGRGWRVFFLEYYGPILTSPPMELFVLFLFIILFCVTGWGFSNMEQGLDLADLAPKDSYLHQFDVTTAEYMTAFDVPTDIFIGQRQDWWEIEVQDSMMETTNRIQALPSTKFLNNPFIRMVQDTTLRGNLRSGDRELFETTLYDALSNPTSNYKQFERDFIWEGSSLVGFRFTLFPAAMTSSEQRAMWMKSLRLNLDEQLHAHVPMQFLSYNYMMIFYESDLGLMGNMLQEMFSGTVAMLMIALMMIPQITAGLIVAFIMFSIDIYLFGFMYFIGIKLNMVSMINLVISIGFSVDYSAHMCHSFAHCLGHSRRARVIESLTATGGAVFHGSMATLLGIIMLGFSKSYIFQVFFKMFFMVVVFGVAHGLILLPVLLSLFGSLRQAGTHSAPDLVDDVRLAQKSPKRSSPVPLSKGDVVVAVQGHSPNRLSPRKTPKSA